MSTTDNTKTVSIIGLGYIGLPIATVIASRNIKVIGVDINENVVNMINSGNVHIVEPELTDVVKKNVAKGLLKATTTPEQADVFLIAVPTPFRDGYEPDLSYVKSASKLISPVLQKGNLIVLESTVPVGTTEKLSNWFAEYRKDLTFPHVANKDPDINISYSPERILPGNAIQELMKNDRVIGGITPECSKRAAAFYQLFIDGNCSQTNSRTAEMAKLTENSFRDVNIAFANELSIICDKLDISVSELIKISNSHPRVNILQPGPGVGGHCIAVDPYFIVHRSPDEAKIIKMARDVNNSKPKFVVNKIVDKLNSLNKTTVECFGITFKPNIDDIRESPSKQIVYDLASLGYYVKVVEPYIKHLPEELQKLENVELISFEQFLSQENNDTTVTALLVPHKEFIDNANLLKNREYVLDFGNFAI